MYNNSTNSTGPTYDWTAMKISYYVIKSSVIFFGTAFNSWMLSALLTSQEMRSSMRNRLVSLILFNDIFRTALVGLFEMLRIALYFEHGVLTHCSFGTFIAVLRFSLMWVENWYVLILMVHYISTLLELDPVKYLSQRNLQIGTVLILAGPWVLSFIVGPSVLAHQSHLAYGYRSAGCVYWTMTSYQALANFGIVTPWFIKMFLIVVILVLNYRRRHQYTTMNAALVGPSTHIDDVKAYVILYVIVAISQSVYVARFVFKIKIYNRMNRYLMYMVSWTLTEIRSVVIPVAFFFLEDIRTRVKTWRPWYRPAPGIDLTVEYNDTKADN